MKFITNILAFSILLCFTSCKTDQQSSQVQSDPVENETSKITLTSLTDSPAYSEAKLILDTPLTMQIEDAGDMSFSFDVESYELGAQTDSPNASILANSDKGQHIHFILNNQPYSAHYESEFEKEIPEGVHHLVAFLSRSYHESVKNDESVVVRKLSVGEAPEDELGIDIEAPTLIYSRPKGEYSGAATENLLLDFFVLNTELSETGNKVVATINEEQFTITKWEPQVIKGLPKGEVNIKLELVDSEGNKIPGPFNTVERTVTLKE